VLDNARALAETLTERGLTLVTGGTDNHMVLVELAPLELAGPTAERALERAHIASNSIPLPDGGAGLRLGTPAVTTRGLGRAETIAVAECVADILAARGADAAVETARERVLALCAAHPVYAGRR
jgi:glycine hydroxymethyltransferase